jgi:hypothetical protein
MCALVGRVTAVRRLIGRQPDPPKQVLGRLTRLPRRRMTAPGCCYPTTQVTAPVVCPSPRGRRAPESGNLDVLREEDLSPQPRSTGPEAPAQPAGGSRGYSSSTLITSRFPKTAARRTGQLPSGIAALTAVGVIFAVLAVRTGASPWLFLIGLAAAAGGYRLALPRHPRSSR